MKFKYFYLIATAAVLVSCDKDSGDILVNGGGAVSDPDGTVIVSIRNDDDWIKLKDVGYISMENDNFVAENDVSGICSVGKVNGLGNVRVAPEQGWASSVAVIPGNGYLVKNVYNGELFARIYVEEYIVGTSGGVIGAYIKYESPFKPENIKQNQVDFADEFSDGELRSHLLTYYDHDNNGYLDENEHWSVTSAVISEGADIDWLLKKFPSLQSYGVVKEDGIEVTFLDGVTEISCEMVYKYGFETISVTIPESVVEMEPKAFSRYKGILYLNCNTEDYPYDSYVYSPFYESEFETIIIGNKVKSIGNYTFYGCSSIKSVTLSDSISSIGESSFAQCDSLTDIIIPDSVTYIGRYAFSGCESLSEITISNNISEINESIFSGCVSLKNIEIPDSVTQIGDYAFFGCSSMTNIIIGDSVVEIGRYVFSGCSSLKSLTFPDSVTSIGEDPCHGCYNIETLVFGDGITSIKNWHFADATNLKSVTIGNNITEIEYGKFRNCTSLASITIGNSVENIEGSVFAGCTSLTNVTIPNSVITIGTRAFDGCI